MKEEHFEVSTTSASGFENKTPASKKIRHSRYIFKSAKEIQETEYPPINCLVENLLIEGLTIFGGKPKVGKSFLCMHLALRIATGEKALNYFDVKKADIIYFALEDSKRRIQRRLNKMLRKDNLTSIPENLLFFDNQSEYIKLNNGGLEELESLLIDYPKTRLIIIDTYGRSVADQKRKDNNGYQKDYELLATLQDFALRKGLCILIVHHLRKTEAEDVFDEISGTLGLNGAADTMIILKKKGKSTKLYVRGRDIEDTEYIVNFDKETCNWNIMEQVEQTSSLTPEREEILELLKVEQREMSNKEIAEKLSKEQSNISHLLKGLKEDGLVVNTKYGFYKIVLSSAATAVTVT